MGAFLFFRPLDDNHVLSAIAKPPSALGKRAEISTQQNLSFGQTNHITECPENFFLGIIFSNMRV